MTILCSLMGTAECVAQLARPAALKTPVTAPHCTARMESVLSAGRREEECASRASHAILGWFRMRTTSAAVEDSGRTAAMEAAMMPALHVIPTQEPQLMNLASANLVEVRKTSLQEGEIFCTKSRTEHHV